MVVSKYSARASIDSGVSYYLPKRLVQIRFERGPAGDSKPCADAKKAAKEAKEKADAAKKKVDLLPKDSPARPKAIVRRDEAVADAAIAAAFQTKTCATPAIVVPAGKKVKESFVVKETPYLPDDRFHFVANLTHNPGRDDSLKIETTPTGLLTSANAVGTDRTDDIFVALVETAGVFRGRRLAADVRSVSATSDSGTHECASEDPLKIDIAFDPTVVDDVASVNDALAPPRTCYTVEIAGVFEDDAPVRPGTNPCDRSDPSDCLGSFDADGKLDVSTAKLPVDNAWSKDGRTGGRGLFYRRPLPYRIDVFDVRGGGKKKVLSKLVLIPNRSPISIVPFETGAFVETKYEVGFKDGMLVSRDVDRPSEIYGFVTIPLKAARALFSVIGEVFQLKIDLTSKDKELIEAQTALLKATRDLEAAESGEFVEEDEIE